MNKRQIRELVDKIGVAKAHLAPQLEALKALEAELKQETGGQNGSYAYEGQFFRATVSVYDQAKLDMDAVREKLSPQFLAANTSYVHVEKLVVKAKLTAVQTIKLAANDSGGK